MLASPERRFPLILLLATCSMAGLSGCVPVTVADVTAGVGADVAIFHRTLADTVYSAVTGRDCSVVRLDAGESYCKPISPPVPPQPYCTRTLGNVECWSTAATMRPGMPRQVAQGPTDLTPDQDRLRLARWPTSLQ